MKWNKTKSCRNLFQAGKDFCPNSGEMKNEIMKFLAFSKIGMDFSLQIIFQKKKKKNLKNNLEIISSQILEKAKNSIISFFDPLNSDGVFGREFVEHDLFPDSNVSDEKSVLITFISSGNEIKLPTAIPALVARR